MSAAPTPTVFEFGPGSGVQQPLYDVIQAPCVIRLAAGVSPDDVVMVATALSIGYPGIPTQGRQLRLKGHSDVLTGVLGFGPQAMSDLNSLQASTPTSVTKVIASSWA